MGDFVDAKTIDANQREGESAFSEYKDGMKKYVNVKSHAKTLEFSGEHYFGLTSANPKTTLAAGNDKSVYPAGSTGFEMRRNYIQVKAYFNDTDYFRITTDTSKELASTTAAATTYIKYAYLYLDKVLPYTGVEIGVAHRPWIDYEEHNSWNYRSFNKVILEEKATATEAGVDLVNSADFGVNFQTKTSMFSSEIGMFNGEGYNADKAAANQKNSKDLSLEWRLTGHILGDGTKVGKNDRLKDTYLNVSTYGLISKNHKDNNATINDPAQYNRTIYGIHAVYNQPEFLFAGQIFTAQDKLQDEVSAAASTASPKGKDYSGLSINAEYRPFQDWTVIGRYDKYKIETVAPLTSVKTVTNDGNKKIVALAYKYNKNVNFIGSAKFIDEKLANGGDTGESKNVYMMTTEVHW